MTLLLSTQLAMAAPEAELWGFWDRKDPTSQTTVDHQDWQTFLDRFVQLHDDGATSVDYRSVKEPDQQQLSHYVDTLAAVDPRRLTKKEQLAYWINLYNALTVQIVLANLEEDSILRMGGGWLPTGPWDDEVVTIAGQALTLNDIEHRILRPIWKDDRIHYAVNCASIGCPNLSTEAYTAVNTEAQLQRAKTGFLNHPRGLKWDNKGRLVLSKIFNWYADDFGGSMPALLAYLANARPDLADDLKNYAHKFKYQYDWQLNQTPAS